MTPTELVRLGTEIVSEATERGALVRLSGGLAIYARCPSIETHTSLQRSYRDLDLIADRRAWMALPDLFLARGFAMQKNTPAHAIFIREGLEVDVRGTSFEGYFSFNLAPRLALAPLTLPLVDLLLLKLQRVDFRENDIKDAIALLLDHRITDGEAEQEIDREYLYKLTNRNWGLWTTVFDNTVELEKILDKYIEPEEAQLVWRRIELIQEVMDGKGKSLGWWLRRIPNKRIRWYRQVDR
jgi:hypothetical protein